MENTLKRKEILKLDKQIESLFSSGRWLRSDHIRLVYMVVDEKDEVPCKALFTASKKVHRRAIKRNLLKRKLREAYRLNKYGFYEQLGNPDQLLLLGFLYTSEDIVGHDIVFAEIKKLLAQVVSRQKKLV